MRRGRRPIAASATPGSLRSCIHTSHHASQARPQKAELSFAFLPSKVAPRYDVYCNRSGLMAREQSVKIEEQKRCQPGVIPVWPHRELPDLTRVMLRPSRRGFMGASGLRERQGLCNGGMDKTRADPHGFPLGALSSGPSIRLCHDISCGMRTAEPYPGRRDQRCGFSPRYQEDLFLQSSSSR
jgi:hypothetical protein